MPAQSTLDRAFASSAYPVAFVSQGNGGFQLVLAGLTGTGRPVLSLYDHTSNGSGLELVLRSDARATLISGV